MNVFQLTGGVAFLVSLTAFLCLREAAPRKLVRFFITAAPISWGGYLLWEVLVASRGWDIRIDLFLIFPILMILSAGALMSWIVAFFAGVNEERDDGLS